ncbi:hypothetical protein [Agrobacterium sp.]|uniref:hypothetical protein n=1 Tax=Agrobacterium sp. TaxID=361 RepID=UPI0028B0A132|nr:hypothetical protein [Agrobacterium sp.]
MSNFDGPGAGRGKWAREGVPKKGWECVNVEDLGEPSQICEMCEAMEIRYVQYMRNPRYADTLACGLVCAGHMSEDLIGAANRDKTLKNNTRKRKTFASRRGWYINGKGNPQIKDGWYRVTMFKTPNGLWKGVVNNTHIDRSYFTRDLFESLDDAKRAAFDTMLLAQEHHLQSSMPVNRF